MAADDSVRTDASTVPPSAGRENPDAPSGEESSSQVTDANNPSSDDSASEISELVNAKTVIRKPAPAAEKRPDRNSRSPAAVAKVLLGQRLNHFELEELIGGGGMGAVFRAHDEQLDREVAIKVIPFAGDDADLQRRFRNEAQSAAKLDHPRIARVFDVGHHDDWYYIVFEYVHGVNIRDLVAGSGELSIDDAVFYTCQVAEALQHAANRGIVHRDVKPSNVLIDKDRQVKLVDMGLARSEKMEVSQQDLTASGVTLGTFDYISPEQAKDPRAADLRSDIYSLGCTLYFMLTAEPPYPGGTMLQKLLSHGNSPPPDARLLRNDVSYELTAIIQKMLAKHPEQRYQNTADLIADLRELAFREGLPRSQGVSVIPVGRPNPIANWMDRHSPWLIAGTLLLLSAAWLQFDSISIQDEFVIPPPRADALIQPTIAPMPVGTTEGDSETPLDADISPTPLETADPIMRDPSPESPPTFKNPIPSELLNPTNLDVAPTATAGTAKVDPPSSQSPAVGAVDSEQSMLVEFPRKIRVVGPEFLIEQSIDDVQRDTDGAALTTSLSHALELAERFYVNQIEIATQLIYSEPVIVRRDDLSIISTVGGTSIVFQSSGEFSLKRPHMMSLGKNRIELQDLHFVWDVPRSKPNGGSVLATNENRLIRIIDSSITVRNHAEIGRVYALEVITDQETETLEPEVSRPETLGLEAQGSDTLSTESSEDNTLPVVTIQMDNVIVRGQMTMIHMDYAAALQLQWDNGLLAISQRMIQTNGAKREPPSTAVSPIQLRLSELTAEMPQGMIQMRLDKEGKFPVRVDRKASECIFVVDAERPHVDIVGITSTENDPPILTLRGDSNVYDIKSDQPQSSTARDILLLTDTYGQTATTRLADLSSPQDVWPDEKSVGWNAFWASNRSNETTQDRLIAADFRQYGAILRGFNEKQLPILGRDLFERDTPNTSSSFPASR